MCIIITSMTFVEKQWSLKSICNFPVCILYSYSFVFIFLALHYLLLVVDAQQPFWMPLFKPCSPNKVLCILSKSSTGMHLLLGSNLDTIKLNLSACTFCCKSNEMPFGWYIHGRHPLCQWGSAYYLKRGTGIL